MPCGEDNSSVEKHVQDLKRSFILRQRMVAEEPVVKMLEAFPILRSETQVTRASMIMFCAGPRERCLCKTVTQLSSWLRHTPVNKVGVAASIIFNKCQFKLLFFH